MVLTVVCLHGSSRTCLIGNRVERVVVNGRTSEWVNVKSGVPEGALLAPLLFSLFINDLPLVVASSKCVMYADDVKIYRQISSDFECGLLQKDIDNISKWSSDWRLILNPQKCASFTITLKRAPILHSYSINNSPLQRVAEVRDLGVILDSKLTFSSHINATVSTANRALGLLIRSFQTSLKKYKFDRKALLVAYNANIRSILEYGSIIWSGAAKTHLTRLERVQHKFLIWLAARARGTDGTPQLDYHSLLAYFNVTSLEARRKQFDLVFLKSIFSGATDSSFLLSCFSLSTRRLTRRPSLFYVPFARVSTVKNGMFVRLAASANCFCDFGYHVDFFADLTSSHLKHMS